jgi:hypothetical protein
MRGRKWPQMATNENAMKAWWDRLSCFVACRCGGHTPVGVNRTR